MAVKITAQTWSNHVRAENRRQKEKVIDLGEERKKRSTKKTVQKKTRGTASTKNSALADLVRRGAMKAGLSREDAEKHINEALNYKF